MGPEGAVRRRGLTIAGGQPGRPQLELALGAFENRRLFSANFLFERLPEWPVLAAAADPGLHRTLRELWAAERGGLATANEAQTEERLVKPVLTALGFAYTVQAGLPTATGRRQPDYALFLDDDLRAEADLLQGGARYDLAVAVADAKRFDRPLDGRGTGGDDRDDPVAQIINYVSITKRRWGILTNGRLWRLYAAEGDLVEGACYQVDLIALLEQDDPTAFAYFAAFFTAGAFVQDADGRCFLDRALGDSRANAVRVGDALERQVFAAVPLIAEGLLGDDERTPQTLAVAFDHALVFLYRLLFCLYAEARRLLPVENAHYRPYSLLSQRRELARDIDAGRVFSLRSDDLYSDLRALFTIVDQGDEDLAVNEYDGGLFSAAAHPWLIGRSVPDRLLAPALDGLYRAMGQQVDYRDLSPRHLGTIYERLLDFRLHDEAGALVLRPAEGRHDTGSYYTPSHVVDAIVEATLEPLLARRSQANADLGLRGRDALETFLELRVLDPAMGSGHFLVAAAAYIAQYVATDPSYDGKLALTDIQRMVAERCLYGVDLNAMAVELARLSLWLSTVRGDEPLTFLANLRVGNSLVGAELAELLAGEGDLFADRLGRDAGTILARLDEIRARGSRAGDDVHAKARLAEEAAALREPLEHLADEAVAARWRGAEPPDTLHWALEFPEVFLSVDGRPRDDGGFHAVVGNPPYVRIQALGRDLAAWARRRYATAKGSFDVYVPFLERGVHLLAPGGRLGFIVPNKFLKLDYGRGLRELLSRERLVEEIIDFGDAQVFPGATNYTCVVVLDRAGADELTYRRVRGDADAVRRTLVRVERAPTESFRAAELGGDPWVLATGEERALLRAAADGAARLGDVAETIFTGLQTSADSIYILEDRGRRGATRVVYSRASDRELELEPELLRPLASGTDTDRYAFRPLRKSLLFPYRRGADGRMALLTPDELARLPLTAAYLGEHEGALRGREKGKMDHDGWYAYVYPKSLGAHDRPKLGVPRLCDRLEAAVDPEGEVYLDNVDVNGILVGERTSVWTLGVLLNSRLLDFLFRRFSVPFRGEYFSANKQFIAPLPIHLPPTDEAGRFDDLGRRLHTAAGAVERERGGFLDWLSSVLEVPAGSLSGATKLAAYDTLALPEVLAIPEANRSRLTVDPASRAFRELLEREWSASLDRLGALRSDLLRDEALADGLVFELYGLTASQRALVDAEFTPPAP